jgi:hypothetical protein
VIAFSISGVDSLGEDLSDLLYRGRQAATHHGGTGGHH